ncbi:MAG: hypothetical protein SPJ34_03020 [Candidatus Ornithospirochaeta sp.]|nr:hypothetical protein [Candidatus Ornithospirochaeta sp.]
MIQLYFLSIVYLVFSSLLLLLPEFRRELSFMLRIKAFIMESSHALDALFYSGLLLFFLMLLFPIKPGPRIIGDAIPAFFIAGEAFFFRMEYSEKRKGARNPSSSEIISERRRTAGAIGIAIAAMHFLFPSIVLL